MPERSTIIREAAQFRAAITPAKISIDECLAEMGKLLTHITTTSVRAGLATSAAHPALIELQTGIAGALDARGALVRVHGAAKEVGRTLIPELDWGPTEDTNPMPREAMPQPSLEVVR